MIIYRTARQRRICNRLVCAIGRFGERERRTPLRKSGYFLTQEICEGILRKHIGARMRTFLLEYRTSYCIEFAIVRARNEEEAGEVAGFFGPAEITPVSPDDAVSESATELWRFEVSH